MKKYKQANVVFYLLLCFALSACVFMFGCSNKDDSEQNNHSSSVTPTPKETSTPEATPTATASPTSTSKPTSTSTPTPYPTERPVFTMDSVDILARGRIDDLPAWNLPGEYLWGHLKIDGSAYIFEESERDGPEFYHRNTYSYIQSPNRITFCIVDTSELDENIVYPYYYEVSYEDFLAYMQSSNFIAECRMWLEGDVIVRVLVGSYSGAG